MLKHRLNIIKLYLLYAWITEQIKNAVDIDWIEIETSNLTISQVRDKTVKILNLERRK